MVLVIGILIGAVLGTRYKVLCLVPVTLAGILMLAALDLLNEAPLSSTALGALSLAVGLQIGYLAGLAVQSVLWGALARSFGGQRRLRDQPARIS